MRERLDARGLTNVGYVANPEFLAEGSAVRGLHARRTASSSARSTPDDAERVVELHRGIETEVVRTDVASAELVKLAANAFLSTRISFINEIANVCELVGADVVDVAKGVGLDHRLGPHFLRAGIGFGGSCFPKDVTALKQLAGNSGYPFLLLQAVWEVNELQKRRVVSKLQRHLGSLRGKTIALLGLAFKPNTDDMREAPSRVIAYRLLSEGAEVRGWDPVAQPDDLPGRRRCAAPCSRRSRGADAAVIVTEWPELRSLASPEVREAMARPLIVDGRNLLDPGAARAGRLRVRGDRPADITRLGASQSLMEALLLAGGKAERLGEAAQGHPKPLVPVAGYPLAEYTVAPARRRRRDARDRRLPRRTGGGLRQRARRSRRRDRPGRRARAARARRRPSARGVAAASRAAPCSRSTATSCSTSTSGALLAEHESTGAAATIVVAQVHSPFGVVDLDGRRRRHRLPRGPEAAALGELRRLRARRGGARAAAGARRPRAEHVSGARGRGEAARHRHEGVWLTVNTPKDLRRAEEFMHEHPEWRR